MLLVYFPVPVRVAGCGLLLAASDTCNLPVVGPAAVGVKTTSMVHVASEVNCVPHVVEETLKSPVVETTIFSRTMLWRLSNLNAFAALFAPIAVFAKVAVA